MVAPAAPTGVSVARSGSGAQVSWAAVSGADSYTVERRTSGTTTWQSRGHRGYDDELHRRDGRGRRRLPVPCPGEQLRRSLPRRATLLSCRLSKAAIEILAGTIEGHVDLDASITYTLQGVVTVVDGGELHIPAGTTILGSTEVTPTALIVARGGQIHSEGTADAPVVFTSANPVGERRRGDWGGIAIFGYSNCNFPSDDCIAEGIGHPYGGMDPMDNSGSMTYTRV